MAETAMPRRGSRQYVRDYPVLGIERHFINPRLDDQPLGPKVAGNHVTSRVTDEVVVAARAGQRVGAVAAVDDVVATGAVDDVVAAAGVDTVTVRAAGD